MHTVIQPFYNVTSVADRVPSNTLRRRLRVFGGLLSYEGHGAVQCNFRTTWTWHAQHSNAFGVGTINCRLQRICYVKISWKMVGPWRRCGLYQKGPWIESTWISLCCVMLATNSWLDYAQHSGQTPPSKSLQDATASSAETDWASQMH